jgi:DNA invertase Pin-like site-specific DNA recombinase
LEFSLDAQRKALIAYAESKGLDVLDEHIFVDEGKSGRTAEKRPEFMRMIGIARSKPKPFDVILVHKFDRFARNRNDSIFYKQQLRKDCQINVVSISEPLDENDPISILIESLLEAIAEYYSANLSTEVKKGMMEKALRGEFQSSPALGYHMTGGEVVSGKLVGAKLTIHPEESKYITYIYDQFLNHDKTQFQIAKALNEMGVTSKRGNKMDNRGVDYILRNRLYTGMVRWTPEKTDREFDNPKTIWEKGEHDPIITENIFNAVSEKLAELDKTKKKRERPTDESSHWLSGLIKCSNCEKTLAVANKLKYPSFQCHGYTHGQCAVSHSVTIKKMETAVLNEISFVLDGIGEMTFDVKEKKKLPATNREKINLLQVQINKFDDKIKRADEAYISGSKNIDWLNKTTKNLKKQKQEWEADIAKLKKEPKIIIKEVISQKVGNLVELLTSNCSTETKKRAVRSIIHKITYRKESGSIEVYYYDM